MKLLTPGWPPECQTWGWPLIVLSIQLAPMSRRGVPGGVGIGKGLAGRCISRRLAGLRIASWPASGVPM